MSKSLIAFVESRARTLGLKACGNKPVDVPKAKVDKRKSKEKNAEDILDASFKFAKVRFKGDYVWRNDIKPALDAALKKA